MQYPSKNKYFLKYKLKRFKDVLTDPVLINGKTIKRNHYKLFMF